MNFTISDVLDILPENILTTYAKSSTSPSFILESNNYCRWFDNSQTAFFRTYTDHSSRHSFDVFQTAVELMSDTSHQAISTEDINILLLSCFAHDCGMHLTEKQFLLMVDPSHRQIYSSLDVLDWPTLWQEFLQEAKRFNEETLVAIFGDAKPVVAPPSDPLDFSERHRLLIGEFIRRHHPAIAHSISLGMSDIIGLPELGKSIGDDHRDIVGLISRSHGAPLRAIMDYVGDKYNYREFAGIHILYLCILLRIADFLQIQSASAPRVFTKIHEIRSPISKREWRVHQSVRNIHATHDDPDSVYFESAPQSLPDFLRVESWLTDLQRELDTSWAVLGEIYGRQSSTALDKLGLRIRRVRSNILSKKDKYPFVAEAIRFKVAESKILSLLLSPLYGDHPIYGLRELVQNSRDACLEAQNIQPQHHRRSIQVVINASDNPFVSISDDGIGMNFPIIRDYFLNAGASFRSSTEWKKHYINEEGHSVISRSGRFGVGALAAFLIGNKITVKTRHQNEQAGFGHTFSCSLHDAEIEVTQCEMSKGTEIVIHSNLESVHKLIESSAVFSHLFAFKDVDLNVFLPSENSTVDEIKEIGIKNEEESFRHFKTSKYPLVLWSKSPLSFGPLDYVNGIAIAAYSANSYKNIDLDGGRVGFFASNPIFKLPTYMKMNSGLEGLFSYRHSIGVQVTDPNALAPINLSRTALTGTDEEITEEIVRHCFEELITSAKRHFEKKARKSKADESSNDRIQPIIRETNRSYIYVNDTIAPIDHSIIEHCRIKKIYSLNPEITTNIWQVTNAFKDIAFTLTSKRSLVPTGLREELREMSWRWHSGGCSSIMLVDLKLRQKLEGLSGTPKWMKEFFGELPTINSELGNFYLAVFGNIDDSIIKEYLSVFEKTHDPSIELYLAPETGFKYIPRWYSENAYEETMYAKLWVDRIGGFMTT